MLLTDTHTHLYSEQFDHDIDEVMMRAKDAGIRRFFLPAIDREHYPAMFRLQEKYPDEVFLMSGLHPTSVKENFREELDFVRAQLQTGRYCAIGEIGIDLYWDKTFFKEQVEAFNIQIDWAIKQGLPIVIHSRESFDEIFEVLEDYKGQGLGGIFHCFTGDEQQARRAIDMGFYLGIGGVLTFKNGGIDKYMDRISLEHLVLETDSPYLAPKPYRGKRNESGYLIQVLKRLAELHGVEEKEIAQITTENSKRIFGC